MAKRERCTRCNEDVEVDQEIVKEDPYEKVILLKCGHSRKEVARAVREHISISDSVSIGVRHLISFDSEEDRKKGLYALINSKSRFNGIEKNKFLITQEQGELLKNKNIKYKRVEK